MLSFSRLIAAESLALVGATVPFQVQNGTLLWREQTRSCLRKDCRLLARPDLPIRIRGRTRRLRLRDIPPLSALATQAPRRCFLARPDGDPVPGFPPSRGGVPA